MKFEVTYVADSASHTIVITYDASQFPCKLANVNHPRSAAYSEGGIISSSVCLWLCLFVCLIVYMITLEPLEISSRNFQGIILWRKGQIRKCLYRIAQVVRKCL